MHTSDERLATATELQASLRGKPKQGESLSEPSHWQERIALVQLSNTTLTDQKGKAKWYNSCEPRFMPSSSCSTMDISQPNFVRIVPLRITVTDVSPPLHVYMPYLPPLKLDNAI